MFNNEERKQRSEAFKAKFQLKVPSDLSEIFLSQFRDCSNLKLTISRAECDDYIKLNVELTANNCVKRQLHFHRYHINRW